MSENAFFATGWYGTANLTQQPNRLTRSHTSCIETSFEVWCAKDEQTDTIYAVKNICEATFVRQNVGNGMGMNREWYGIALEST